MAGWRMRSQSTVYWPDPSSSRGISFKSSSIRSLACWRAMEIRRRVDSAGADVVSWGPDLLGRRPRAWVEWSDRSRDAGVVSWGRTALVRRRLRTYVDWSDWSSVHMMMLRRSECRVSSFDPNRRVILSVGWLGLFELMVSVKMIEPLWPSSCSWGMIISGTMGRAWIRYWFNSKRQEAICFYPIGRDKNEEGFRYSVPKIWTNRKVERTYDA